MKLGYPLNMVSISKYTLEYNNDDNIYYVESGEISVCPICASELTKKGRRQRKSLTQEGLWRIFSIRRLKCCKCKKTHHELPDCIVPYKRYGTHAIENIVMGFTEVFCEESTIRRIKIWWTLMQTYVIKIAASLSAKYEYSITEVKKVAEIVRLLANSNSWPGTRSALKPG